VKERKAQIIELWRTVFNDSEDFIRLYFERVYKEEYAFVIERNGQVVSALQMLPYTMSCYGEEISVGYISGACTLPSERRKGRMNELLRNVSAEMKERHITIAALIPAEAWLFDYYRSKGYTEAFDYSLRTYTRSERFAPSPNEAEIVVRQETVPNPLLYAYFDRKLRERPLSMLHSYEDFAVILEDLKLSGGYFFVASEPSGRPLGMAWVYPGPLCKELLYDNEQVKDRLLYEITGYLHVEKAAYRIPADGCSPTLSYGMAQVLDAERLSSLQTATHPAWLRKACMSLMLD
jgi:hypothetical protein